MPRCHGITKKGAVCTKSAKDGDMCHLHAPKPDCSICMEEITPQTKYRIGCGGDHVFHKKCINSWFLLGKDTCPYCRDKVDNPLILNRIEIMARVNNRDILVPLTPQEMTIITNLLDYYMPLLEYYVPRTPTEYIPTINTMDGSARVTFMPRRNSAYASFFLEEGVVGYIYRQ